MIAIAASQSSWLNGSDALIFIMAQVDELFVHLQSKDLKRPNHNSLNSTSLGHVKHVLTHSIPSIHYSHPKRLSVQSAPSQRRRSRTVLFPSGSVFALTILSSITQRDVIGVVPSLVFKLVLMMVRKIMGQIGVLVIDALCWEQ